MKKTKHYRLTRFSPEALREALLLFRSQTDWKKDNCHQHWTVDVDDANWQHDSEEEFFADYRRSTGGAVIDESLGATRQFRVQVFSDSALAQIAAESRHDIEAVFEILNRHLSSCRLPEPSKPPHPPVRVFIGHGGSPLWRDLKDHLQDKHDYDVEAYEVAARAGHAVRDVLGEMLRKSSFALLVMTGEDETADGAMRARQNVIHEIGLFQGRLGFTRALVLLEEGTEEFSNIHGVEQVRFGKGNIKETFGEVLATLRREFREDAA